MVSRHHMPWFDECVQSAALGRSLIVEHMHAKGLGFVVHPLAYILQSAAPQEASQADFHASMRSDVRHPLVAHIVHFSPQ